MDTALDDRLELALKASNEGIWEWDLVTNEVFYSERVLEFMGARPETAKHIFSDVKECFHPSDVEPFEEAVQSLLVPGGEELLAADSRFQRPDGDYVWLRIRGACVRDAEGNVVRMAGSMIDCSRRKNAEQAAVEERHRLRMLIESIPMNVYFKDRESRFVMANTATAQKLGCDTVEELMGLCDHDFFDLGHADKSRADEMYIMAAQEDISESLERELWEGKEQTWVITSKMPWRDSEGAVKGVFGVTSDVTDLMMTQRRLEMVMEELRKRNAVMEEELQLAREVQQATLIREVEDLPRSGATPYKAHFGYYYEPVSGMAGDFFDVIPISDTRSGVLICDVMGHGTRAALVVSMLRGLLEEGRKSAGDPSEFLSALNDGLVNIFQRAGITMFATAFYGVVDVADGTLTYACAGHPEPLLQSAEGVGILEMEGGVKGPAMGLIEGMKYGAAQMPLAGIERMVLFTDGLFESENSEGDMLGVDRVGASMGNQPLEDRVEDVLEGIVSEARNYVGEKGFGDDVCMIGMSFANSAMQEQ